MYLWDAWKVIPVIKAKGTGHPDSMEMDRGERAHATNPKLYITNIYY